MSNINQIIIRREFSTRFISMLKRLIDDSADDESLIKTIRVQLGHLPERIAQYEDCHQQILAHPDHSAKHDELWELYDAFHEDVRNIETICAEPPFKNSIPTDQCAILNTGFNTTVGSANSGACTRLPKLNLNSFDGTISEWSSYFDIFQSAVHGNESLHAVQKFQYLKSTLKGEPLSLIKSLPLTDANYTIALDTLKSRYARPRLISAYHLQSIINLSPLTSMSYEKVNYFVSTVNEHVAALRAQNEPVDAWSRVLTFILLNKIDVTIRNKFEGTLDPIHLPELSQLLRFLETFISAQQWQTIGNYSLPRPDTTRSQRTTFSRAPSANLRTGPRTSTFFTTTSSRGKCTLCDLSHPLYLCDKFHQLELQERHDLIQLHQICINCLSRFHHTARCKSQINCRKCNKRHHTMLHSDGQAAAMTTGLSQSPSHQDTVQPGDLSRSQDTTISHSTTIESQTSLTSPLVLLGTAIVSVADSAGDWKPVRALLDSGSEATYITTACLNRLQLPCVATNLVVSGFANVAVNTVSGTSSIRLCSRHHDTPIYKTAALVVPNITRDLPKQQLSMQMFNKFRHLTLADPEFCTPAPIDLLIGANLYFSLLTGNKTMYKRAPVALETTLGWIISGPIPTHSSTHIDSFVTTYDDPIAHSLTKFWELEDMPTASKLSQEDTLAEHLFSSQHYRNTSGRYVVPLLFKDDPPTLGNSHTSAIRCYRSLRQQLSANSTLQIEYTKFMTDYLASGHMSLMNPHTDNASDGYYLPHHGVFKLTDSTPKLRVVFNGSKKTSLNTSLNEQLLTGPALQADLTAVITRSRLHKFTLTADIRQMYRQILIPKHHCKYQKILWNFDITAPPQTYYLNTVTYGTSCAPFVALRVLQQLAVDDGADFPLAAKALQSDTYVDDIITGANTLTELQELKTQLIALLAKAGLELRKWTSNHPSILDNVPEAHREQFQFYVNDSDAAFKILGLIWLPTADHYTYCIKSREHLCTKRSILSDISSVFDPLGWIAPSTMIAKCIMQELWTLGIDWDTTAPPHISSKWVAYKRQLPDLTALKIPRHVDSSGSDLALLGFCDASEMGYAAVVYLHGVHGSSTSVSLIAAKSRVAPLKRVSLPRLELCAALLLSRLLAHIIKTIQLNFDSIYAWSDSTVALAWIHSPAYRWKTFVSNRVTEIHDNIPPHCWHHVRSQDNPADCASRGIFPQDLISHPLWWHGPSWLRQSPSHWPLRPISELLHKDPPMLEEARITLITQAQPEPSLITRYSSLDTLLRITSRCLRFFANCRHQPHEYGEHVSATELDNALLRWIRLVQAEAFGREIQLLNQNKICSKHIQRLSPFVDNTGLLRVGGRLHYAHINHDQMHPVLLPSQHTFTTLLVNQYHLRYLHPSPRTLQALLERRFWILSIRKVTRSCTSKCMKCFHCNPTAANPIMGNLPLHRVVQSKPFDAVGVDYGGPFHITPYKGRGCKSVKAYLCLFVCFSTKALHLELASDLSTDAFLAAFRRFISRRGRCSHIYSDSGTNFVGAKRYFTELQKFVTDSDYNTYFSTHLAPEGIEWHLNPPSAPHFGGLWEAGIKSVKHHILRVIGQQILTFEEFYTALCQIESILNSRPLCQFSTDPNDLRALTPNHFLMQEPVAGLPDRDYLTSATTYLTRWQLIQRIQQDFWKRWHNEYLCTLQHRPKWITPATTLKLHDLVLIKDNLLPPLQWRLGRVLQLYPGPDGVTRVAQVKTSTGILTRPMVKLCPLPM